MAIDPRTVYTDPQAQAAILMGEQTPEKTQIARRIMEEGLSGAMEQMNQPAGIQTVQAAPPSGIQTAQAAPPPSEGGEADISTEQLLQQGLGTEESTRQREFEEKLKIGNWLLINEKEPVPWAKGLTWGQYIDSILTMKGEVEGRKAVEQIILQQIKQEEEKRSQPEGDIEVRNLPTIPAPQAPQVAPGGPPAPPQGIMAAAEGGLIPPTAPVDEGEFIQTLANMAQGAGVSEEQAGVIAENIEVPANDDVMDSGIMQTVEAVEATESDLSGIGSLEGINRQLVDAGKEGLVHATPGELIFDPSRLNESDQRMLLAALETAGIDPAAATVGDPANILNQMTGLPAFGFFSKIWKKTKRAVKKVGKWMKRNAGTILGIAGAMTGNPWLAALGAGIGSLIEGKPIQSALLSAGMSFVGTKWVGPWISEAIGGVGGVGGAVPSLGKTSIGEAAGEVIPGQFGQSLGEIGGQYGLADQAIQTAGEAATSSMISSTGKMAATQANKLAFDAAMKSMSTPIVEGGSRTLLSSLGQEATEQMARDLVTEAGSQMAGGVFSQGISAASQFTVPQAGLGSLIGTAPSFTVGTPVGRLLGTSVADALGGAAAGAMQRYAEPMIEQMFVPGDQEADVLDAWNQRYDYTPSPGELYTFYTNEYIPNQQIDVAQTIGGIPGYQDPIFQAAGGGYIKGKGTPKSDSNLALVSDGEFVMTEAATRGADPLGLGSRMRGARKMYDSMKELEARVA